MKTSKRRAAAAAALMAGGVLAWSGAWAQPAPAATPVTAKPGPHALKLVNGGRSAISAVYVAPPDSLDWSDDLLGKQVAAPGKTVTLSIKDPSGACVFDLQFLMNNGDTVEKKAVNVCDQPSYAFTP